ncbi:MAG: hypothetical protein AUJ96_27085 [Armatimonadetes bacterium CG2_30_66_41]|nr:hypothetical protein [Armatimonadota bacterium]OIO95277.1 MAG: hypothetical protein AUJ96_27085 [Armatimonadetes bacterium CG2_30_66_41]NCO90806.1 hypothetical protein [Armatimonadota bacterium]NCP31608.1 hypothetical protein [Armatimonadota bacterium]NCQ32519.1 hypothetical protein [Armatimonadota bacterium]
MKRWWIAAAYGSFFVALNWPVLLLVNRIEPRVGATPFLVAWCLFWSIAIAVFHAAFLFSVKRDPVASDGSADPEVTT